jgi:hypothetical protein
VNDAAAAAHSSMRRQKRERKAHCEARSSRIRTGGAFIAPRSSVLSAAPAPPASPSSPPFRRSSSRALTAVADWGEGVEEPENPSLGVAELVGVSLSVAEALPVLLSVPLAVLLAVLDCAGGERARCKHGIGERRREPQRLPSSRKE